MKKYPWVSDAHKETLVQARALLVTLVEPTSFATEHPTIFSIQQNTEEEEMLQGIIGQIEELLGY